MSGICGFVRFDQVAGGPGAVGAEAEAAEDGPSEAPGVGEDPILGPMLEAGAFRGPDGRGAWLRQGIALAHLALHDTPEAAGERQPVADGEADLVLVADARIDNREDLLLRLGLEPGGNAPRIGDARLILAAYRRWGVECARALVGDFAFVVWDARRGRLFAARDAMGMRGLHYRRDGERVLFATEAEQILAVPGVPAELFEPAVGVYLAGGGGPGAWTFYRGIEQLAPAHALVADADGLRAWRYWDIDPGARIRHRRDEDYAEHFRELFTRVVRSRLRSHRPVGILLSGGMDSGSITAAAGRLLGTDGAAAPSVRAYSSAFEELPECDERRISDPLARHYGIPVTGVPADDAWPLKDLDRAGPYRDEPFTVVYQKLMERRFAMAREEGVRLVLTGERGDEMVGDWIYDVPGLLARGRWGAVVREIRAHPRRARRFAEAEILRPALARLGREPTHRGRRPGWIPDGFAGRIGLEDAVQGSIPNPPVKGWARRGRYLRIFRPGGSRNALWHDRCAARAGVSWADPWSDRRLAEFILAVPQHLVNRVAEPKRLARRAMEPAFPPEVRDRVSKVIPAGLYERGLKDRERDRIRNLLADPVAKRLGFFEASAVSDEYERYLRGERIQHSFWWPLTLEAWLRAYW